MALSIENILKKAPPVIFIYGEEEFLISSAFNQMVEEFVKKFNSSNDLDIYDSDNIDLYSVIDSCFSFPFLGEKRIVGIKNFEKYFSASRSKKIDEKHPLVKYLISPNFSTIFIISAYIEGYGGLAKELSNAKTKDKALKKIQSAKFPYNIIFEKAALLEFPKFYEKQISSWIKSQLNGKEISPEAIELIMHQTNPNLRDINNELQKLLLFTEGKNEINEDDVATIVGISKEFNVFQLQKAIGKKDLSESLKILKNMLRSERQEILIITMLARYFTILWQLQEEISQGADKSKLASKLGINIYFFDEYLQSSKNYSEQSINNIFNYLYQADKELKTSSVVSLIIMERLIIQILSEDGN